MRCVYFSTLAFLLAFGARLGEGLASESLNDDQSDSLINLPLIVKQGTPGEVLSEDVILPAQKGPLRSNSTSGFIQNSLQNQMALPVSDYGKPGNLAQLKGLGASAEELDVQAFGISLNPPQGGGFNLSLFPQFLWSQYQFQNGPSLNGLNPTAASGTLMLTPWSAAAIHQPGLGGRGLQFASTGGIFQTSVAAREGSRVAAVAGYSGDQVRGPSAGLSAQWGAAEPGRRYQGQFHLLATDLNAQTPGPTYAFSPSATTRTARVIPVIQNDFRFGSSSLLKTSLFFDSAWLHYENEERDFFATSLTRQWGGSQVFLTGDWKFGFQYRQVYYSDHYQLIPSQNFSTLQVSRILEWSTLLIEPNLQGIWASGFGFLPQGSLGVRREFRQGSRNVEALFLRGTVSHRLPSLLDRFYSDLYFTGNPSLKTELDWTGTVGGEVNFNTFQGSLQFYTQWRKDARVLLGPTVTNLGDARVSAVLLQENFQLSPQINFFNSDTFTNSRLSVTKGAFPYLPALIHVTGVQFHSKKDPEKWSVSTNLRIFTSQLTQVVSSASNETLGGYGIIDMGAQAQVWKGIYFATRVENLFNRSVEVVRGYPLQRALSITLGGEL